MAIALFGFLNLFVGGGGIFVLEAIFVSVLTILIVPALTLFFADNELDLNDLSYSKMRPSPFIGRGEISSPFLYGAAIQGASLLAVLFIMFAAFGGMIPVEQSSDVAINTAAGGPKFNIEQIRAIFLTTFMSAGIMMAWVGLSAHEPFYKSFILEALKKRGTRGVIGNPVVMISGGLFLFTLLVIHLPYVNSAFGVQAPGIGYFIIAVLAGALSQVWYDFIKKRFTA
jgi:predicted secreted protein